MRFMNVAVTFVRYILFMLCCRACFADASELSCLAQIGSNCNVTATFQRNSNTWNVICVSMPVLSGRVIRSGTNSVFTEHLLADEDIRNISTLAKLDSLNIYGSDASTVTTNSTRMLVKLSSLRNIDCSCSVFAKLPPLPELASITLSWDSLINVEMLDQLKKYPGLRRLNLKCAGLSDSIFAYVKTLTGLQDLDVSGDEHEFINKITDDGVAQLHNLVNLRSLNLKRTATTPRCVETLKDLPSLETLAMGWDFSVTNTNANPRIDLSAIQKLRCVDFETFSPGRTILSDVCLPETVQNVRVKVKARNRLTISDWMRRVPNLSIAIDLNTGGTIFSHDPQSSAPVNLNELKSMSNIVQVSLLNGLTRHRVLDNELSNLSGNCSVKKLVIAGDFTNEGIRSLSACRQLESLEMPIGMHLEKLIGVLHTFSDIHSLAIGGVIDLNTERMLVDHRNSNLRCLNFGGGYYSQFDVVLARLQGLDRLEELIIHQETISDEGLRRLSGLKNLRYLDLMYSKGYTYCGLVRLMNESPNLKTIIVSFM